MKKLEPAVFIPAALLILAGVAYALIAGEQAEAAFGALQSAIISSLGWFYAAGVGVFLAASLIVAFSDWGRIKLGPDDSEPEYRFLPWFAMMFSAGMGIGLMFFGVAEPMLHYLNPPEGAAQTVEAARQAMVLTFFHWGVHAWGIYVVVGLSLAYFAFRHGLPLTMRSALYPLIGDRIYGPIGHAVDVTAIVGTMFGVATSLGYGVTQINAGLGALFGVGESTLVQVGLIALITAIATISVVSGLDAGIKRLSELNLYLAIALLAFVFIAGPTAFLISAFVQNIGDYLDQFATLTFNVDAYGDGEWVNAWTLFYWGWWISWSPFVGMFIARISRGRTIREFIFGALIGPTLFTFVWMTIYGDSALRAALADAASPIVDAVASGRSELALFAFLEGLPWSAVTSVVAMALVVTFFVTSSDSGSLVIDTLASGGAMEPPVWQRVFWATLEGAVAAVLLLAGGLAALRSAAIAAALPFTLVILLALIGLIRAWSVESARRQGVRTAHPPPVEGATMPWRTRLRMMFSRPVDDEVDAYLRETVEPALSEVAEEIASHGPPARVEREDGVARLVVEHEGDQPDFVYGVETKRYDEPHLPGAADADAAPLTRAEVFLSEGGQHYDVFGYSKLQVIRDVLRAYESHLQWLHHLARQS